MTETLAILVTGGTFDKEYDELTGRLFFRDTHVGEMLRLGRSRLEVSVETVMMVDSLYMDDAGRSRIVERCAARGSDRSSSHTAPIRWSRPRARLPRPGSTAAPSC